MIFLLITVSVCWILAAMCNAVMDVLAFKYKKSIFKNLDPEYWNPSISWRNKYKNKRQDDGPAFFLSTTALVFVTDAWHLFQFLSNSLIILAVIMVFYTAFPYTLWWHHVLVFIGMKAVWGMIFELFFSNVFRDEI